MTEIVVVWDRLKDLFASMNEVGTQSDEIVDYFSDYVCNKDGLTGVLSPLGDAMPTLSGWFDNMDGVFDRRWAGVANAIEQSARDVDRVDQSVTIDIDRLRGYGPSSNGNNSTLTVDVPRLIKPKPLKPVLTEPERGEDQLKHDKKFNWVADTWDNGVDTLKAGVDFLNRIGLDVPAVPIESLRDYVVYPLSGDWGAIRANGNACKICRKGMQTWGNNFSLLSGEVAVAMQGQTSLRLGVHINLYNIAVRSMGAGVNAGSVVFDDVALVCERIGKEVEDALVWLGKKVAKLLGKIGVRIIPYAGWAILALELIFKGKEAFTDIWDDCVACFETVNDLLDLVDEVKAWAETQADRLDTFKQVLEVANDLPVVGNHQGVDDLVADVGTIEKSLRDVAAFGEGDSKAGEDLDATIEDLDDRTAPGPAPDPGFHKEPLPLDPDDDGPLPGPGERLTY